MGQVMENYCDGCGDSVGQGTLLEAFQVTAIGSSGRPVIILLCTKPDFSGKEQQPSPEGPKPPKITGCARKLVSKTMLAKLYEEVEEYVGPDGDKPFML